VGYEWQRAGPDLNRALTAAASPKPEPRCKPGTSTTVVQVPFAYGASFSGADRIHPRRASGNVIVGSECRSQLYLVQIRLKSSLEAAERLRMQRDSELSTVVGQNQQLLKALATSQASDAKWQQLYR
jgi:hypothetical protein